MPYWRLFYHVICATRNRASVIDDGMAAVVERSIRATARELDSRIHAAGIMPDHVHIAVSIPPSNSIATVVGRMKGSSSHLLNHREGRSADATFAWQAEYGVLSLSARSLPDVVAYVENQLAHHAEGRLWRGLEQVDDPSPPTKQPA